PEDPRDTTTPNAMLGDMQRLLAGDALSADSRLRAGLPAEWRVGDKTGTGSNGTANDIAVVWPPGRAPVLVVAYFTGSTIPDEARDAVIADAGRIAVASL
ncbi:MAG TPA: serine hydrolase, partial [Reyranella sp.]